MSAATRMTSIARGEGGWFQPAGPEADLVLSTRARLARNLEGIRFSPRATESDLETVLEDVIAAAKGARSLDVSDVLIMDELPSMDRSVLVERHLVSAEFAEGRFRRALVPGESDGASVMVNEEDHLRIQSIMGGFRLYEAWERVNALDGELGRGLDFAFHDEFGFLTTCPSNVGTGLRVSVLVHLPSLVLAQEIRDVIEKVARVGLSVRGFYGEGSDVIGNFFQMSNQLTLGKSEEELVDRLEQATREVIKNELRARDWLWAEARTQIEDRVFRALGALETSRLISTSEVLAHASALRLGVSLELPGMPSIEALNRLVVLSQPAHIQRGAGETLRTTERNARRAALVRRVLGRGNGSNGEI